MKWLTVPSEKSDAALQELRGLRNRRMLGSGIPDCLTGLTARESPMAPHWLVRLNDFLAWLNPALGCVAAVLAVLVAQAADERLSSRRISPAIAAIRPVEAARSVECPAATLPREWRELRLYD